MKTSASVEIAREPDVVFDFTTRHVTEWSTVVVSDEVIEDQGGDVGTTFHTVVKDHGREMEFDGIVTKDDRPTAHSVMMRGKAFDLEVDYLFEDLNGQTKVTQVSHVHPKGALKVLFFLTGWLMKKASCDAAAKELEGLKQHLEEEKIS